MTQNTFWPKFLTLNYSRPNLLPRPKKFDPKVFGSIACDQYFLDRLESKILEVLVMDLNFYWLTENNITISVTDLKKNFLKNFAYKTENLQLQNWPEVFEMIVIVNSVMFEIMSSYRLTMVVLETLFIYTIRVEKITCFCFNYNYKYNYSLKILNYNYNYSSSSNCNSITISITITMKRFSKHCDHFTYIQSLRFCLCLLCGFVLFLYQTY